jgi:hypothetical protein
LKILILLATLIFSYFSGIDRFLLDNMTTWPQAEMEHVGSKVFTLYTPHVHQNALVLNFKEKIQK